MRGQKETWREYEILTLLSSCIKPGIHASISVQNSSKEMKCKIVKFWNFLTTAMMMIIIPFHGRAQVAHAANTLRYERNKTSYGQNHFWRNIAFFFQAIKFTASTEICPLNSHSNRSRWGTRLMGGRMREYDAWTVPAEIVCASVETRQPLGKLNRIYSNCKSGNHRVKWLLYCWHETSRPSRVRRGNRFRHVEKKIMELVAACLFEVTFFLSPSTSLRKGK